MKRQTLEERTRIVNDLLFYIHTHIELDIPIGELARKAHMSPFHLQRVFKEITGETIHRTIVSIRLEKAANLLIANRLSTISQIANLCGYASQTAFIDAFKKRFSMTPTDWRNGGFRQHSEKILAAYGANPSDPCDFEMPEPVIVKRPRMRSYYIRHRGYGTGAKPAWQRLQTFIYTHNLDEADTAGLYHDNPAIKPPDTCRYVACVITDRHIRDAALPSFRIAEGVYAKFRVQGSHETILRFIHRIYHHWIPEYGFETTPKPSYAIYRKNGFLEPDGRFDMDYFVSIRV